MVLLLIAALGLIWYFVPMQVVRWIGGYELTVRIESDKPVRTVRLIPMHNRHFAEKVFEDAKDAPAVLNEFKSTRVEPFEGRPIGILILIRNGRREVTVEDRNTLATTAAMIGFVLSYKSENGKIQSHDQVYGIFQDHVLVGVLELNQIIRVPDSKQKIERFIKPALYIAETQKLIWLMLEACQCVLVDFSNQLKLPFGECCQLPFSHLLEKSLINFLLSVISLNLDNL